MAKQAAAIWRVTAAFLLALAGAAHAGSVTLDVKKSGDSKWTGSCTADIFVVGQVDPVKSGVDVTAPIGDLDPASYDAVVACPTDDGVVKKTAPFSIGAGGSDVKASVALDPGFLLVNVVRFDTPIAAVITVFDERGREVASSKDKAVIPLAPGKVRVLAKVDDKKNDRVVFGNGAATIVAGQKATATVDTTDGELLVTLTDNGRKAGGVAALKQPGTKTRLVELHAGEKGAAPPGSYDLVTQLDDTHDFSEVVTHNVVVLPGKLTQRSVAHSTASIKVAVLVDGRAPPADAKIDVELSAPGASAPFNTASSGDTLKVAGGTFEI
ncbi:MAG TPA: hypothetical protein VGO62_16195, partial [Myxococcota bacterium]